MGKILRISEAAKVLQVTEKTIRNYIKRGFLRPTMWNGKWLVPQNQILELCEKNNITPPADVTGIDSDEIGIAKDEYSDQLIAIGKLNVYENLLRDVQAELSQAHERIAQLEASSAAGWLEARTAKADVESLNKEISGLREAMEQSEKEVSWLRREKDRLEVELSLAGKRNQELRTRTRGLEDRLHARALYGE